MQPNLALAIASSHGHPTHATHAIHTIWSSHTASFHAYRRLGPARAKSAIQSNPMAMITGYMPSYAILCSPAHVSAVSQHRLRGPVEHGRHSKGCGKLHLRAHAGLQPRAPSLGLGQIPLAALEQKQKMPWVCARFRCRSLLLLAPRKPPAGPVRARLGPGCGQLEITAWAALAPHITRQLATNSSRIS